jgi:hypothetical protein
VTEPATVRYGSELLTLSAATDRLLERYLTRLPQALWVTDLHETTLQRDLLRAVAEQSALWVEQRTLGQAMTLLREAMGLDLDRLLRDYGLRRYLERPDAQARQIGLQCLWTPKGTTHAIQAVADLLFDLPHVTLNTGINQVHILVADTHPIQVPTTYWRLVSQEGVWVTLTIDNGLPIVSTFPPVGIDTTPTASPLAWFVVQDETMASWYVVIEGDTLAITQTPPTWGTGTTVPFRVLDGAEGLWELRVDSTIPVLETLPVTNGEPYGYWRLQSSDSADLYYLYVSAEVAVISTVPPPGRDETPTSGNLDWLTVWETPAVPWFLFIAGGTLALTRMQPAGAGTDVVYRVLDEHGTSWELGVQPGSTALELRLTTVGVSTATLLDPSHPFETMELQDEVGTNWWLSISRGLPELSTTFPHGAVNVTPPEGPYHWLRLYDLAGTLWYAYPTTMFGLFDVSTTHPGGLGTAAIQTLGDDTHVRWHLGIDTAGAFAISDTSRRTFEGFSTALMLMDGQEHMWFWRVTGSLPFFEVSDVLWPDSLAQAPWGQIGWLALPSPDGTPRYVFPEVGTGAPTVSEGPPVNAPWGWSEPVDLYDETGLAWRLDIEGDDLLRYTAQQPDDIPDPPTVLSIRDACDALAHVQSAGSVVTVLIT